MDPYQESDASADSDSDPEALQEAEEEDFWSACIGCYSALVGRHPKALTLCWFFIVLVWLHPAAHLVQDTRNVWTPVEDSETFLARQKLQELFGEAPQERDVLLVQSKDDLTRGLLGKITSDVELYLAHAGLNVEVMGFEHFARSEMMEMAGLFLSGDHRSSIFVLSRRGGPLDQSAGSVEVELLSHLEKRYTKDSEALEFVGLAGVAPLVLEGAETTVQDLERMNPIVIPLSLAVLAFVLKSCRLMLVPLVCMFTVNILCFGVMDVIANHIMVISSSVPTIAEVVIVALSFDYSLFLLMRLREELGNQYALQVAMMRTLRHSGLVILGSGFTLSYCWFSINYLPGDEVKSQAVGTILAIFSSMLVSMTLAPALLLGFPYVFAVEEADQSEQQSQDGFDEMELGTNGKTPSSKSLHRSLKRPSTAGNSSTAFWDWWSRLCVRPESSKLVLIFLLVSTGLSIVPLYMMDPSADVFLLSSRNSRVMETIHRIGEDFSQGLVGPVTLVIASKSAGGQAELSATSPTWEPLGAGAATPSVPHPATMTLPTIAPLGGAALSTPHYHPPPLPTLAPLPPLPTLQPLPPPPSLPPPPPPPTLPPVAHLATLPPLPPPPPMPHLATLPPPHFAPPPLTPAPPPPPITGFKPLPTAAPPLTSRYHPPPPPDVPPPPYSTWPHRHSPSEPPPYPTPPQPLLAGSNAQTPPTPASPLPTAATTAAAPAAAGRVSLDVVPPLTGEVHEGGPARRLYVPAVPVNRPTTDISGGIAHQEARMPPMYIASCWDAATELLHLIDQELLAANSEGGVTGSILSAMYVNQEGMKRAKIPLRAALAADPRSPQYSPVWVKTNAEARQLAHIINTTFNEERSALVVTLTPNLVTSSKEAVIWTRRARKLLDRVNADAASPVEAYLLSQTAEQMDGRTSVWKHVPKLIFGTLGGCLLIVGLLFQSVLIAVRSVISIAFTLVVVFAFATGVWQLGWLSQIDVGGTAGLFMMIPCWTFTTCVGLSLDYEIFLVGRISELRAKGLSTREAIQLGVAQTGPVITYAGVIMAIAFGGLMLSQVPMLNQISWICVSAVLLDTFVVRTIVTPALMVALGETNWWPGTVAN